MKNNNNTIPLIRGGPTYRTLNTETVPLFGEEDPVELSISPHVVLSKSILQTRTIGYQNLQATPISRIIELFKEASKIFVKNVPLTDDRILGIEECSKYVTLATGMPVTFVQNALEMIAWTMGHIDYVLEAMSPTGDLTVYDTFSCRRGDLTFGWVPRGRNLGAVVPSNHPGVNSLWMLALTMKYPVVTKPSIGEPFTTHRIITSLYEAGFPEHSCYFLPLSHSLTPNLLHECDLSLIFGAAQTVAPYREHARIKAYGPGESKIIIDASYVDSFGMGRLIDLITDSMMFDGGRSCINASAVIVYGENGTKIAAELAQAVAAHVFHEQVLLPLNKNAKIAAFLDPKIALAIDHFISASINGNDKDITFELRGTPRLVKKHGLTYLLPSVVWIKEKGNRLLGTEFPFPFITVIGVQDKEEMKTLIGNALVLALITDDLKLTRELLSLPRVGKVYVGELTCAISAAEPHEGLLSDFLFEKKAYRTRIGEDVRSFAKLYGKIKHRWSAGRTYEPHEKERLPALFRKLKGKEA
ncbi:MAG: aldehyde dehydrogenase family protein [Candidatus Heimdallarchaeota archaeon]